MLLTYQTEEWPVVIPEMEQLFLEHWQEVGVSKTPPNPDHATYLAMHENGMIHVTTARHNGALAGYLVAIISNSLHYSGVVHAAFDLYYLKPEHRKGMAGVRLLSEAEKALKEAGVDRMFTGTKKRLDMGLLFERQGWTEIERTYTKWIGD